MGHTAAEAWLMLQKDGGPAAAVCGLKVPGFPGEVWPW